MKLLLLLALPVCYAQTCTQTFTPASTGTSPYPGSNVNTAVQNGNQSTVLCFSAGTYGAIDIYNAHPSGVVIMQPASGAAAVLGNINLNGVSNLTITGFNGASSIPGGFEIVNAGQGDSTNITFSNNTMKNSQILVRDNARANANILISGNSITNFSDGNDDGALEVTNTGSSSCPNGIVFQNNTVNGTNIGDGMQTNGAACGTQFVGNDISGFIESGCGGIHCDAFQDDGGGVNTVLNGNYLHNNTDCVLLDDGSSGVLIENNVCSTSSDSSFWLQFGGALTITLNHNTIISAAGAQYGSDHSGNPSSNVTFTNNIMYSQPSQNPGQNVTGTFVQDYNLCPSGCGGTHSLNGTPTFSGGASPGNYAGFALTSSSIGYNAGNDGSSIGIASGTSGPPPPPPTPPAPPTMLTVVVK